MQNIVRQIKTNLNRYQEKKSVNKKHERENKKEIINRVEEDMLKRSLHNGTNEFVYKSSKIPESVDQHFRKKGFIVWRNSVIVKYVLLVEED